jgi:hypothetical protein
MTFYKKDDLYILYSNTVLAMNTYVRSLYIVSLHITLGIRICPQRIRVHTYSCTLANVLDRSSCSRVIYPVSEYTMLELLDLTQVHSNIKQLYCR